MFQVHHCQPGLNNAASRMGHGRDRCLFMQTTLTVSQLTHENSHLQSARTFQTMLVLHRVHGRVHSTRVFQNSYFNKYTEHQIRSSHGSRARRDQVRGEIRPRLHTVCVRNPSDFALLRVRGPNRMNNSHGSTCADTNLFLAEFTKRGRCDNQESGTQHQQRIQHDTTRDVTPDGEI